VSEDIVRPGVGRHRDPWVYRVCAGNPLAEIGLVGGQPRRREDPRTGALDPGKFAVENEAQRVGQDRRMDRPDNISLGKSLDARHVAMPRGYRIEDVGTAERGFTAKDQPVASRCNHRRSEAQLREALAKAHDPRRGMRRADVHLHARLVLDRGDLLERNVEPIRRRIPTRLDERFSPCDIAPIETGNAQSDTLTSLGPIDIAVVHLDAPHPNVAARRLEPELISGTDRARPERSCNDCAEARDGERTIDVEPGGAFGAPVLDRVGDARECGAKLVETFARARTHAHDLDSGDELDCLGLRELDRLLVDGIDLRQRDDTVLDPYARSLAGA
jgi:hypothetical protein